MAGWIKSPRLQAALPKLKSEFDRLAHTHQGVFPLVSQHHLDRAWKNFPEITRNAPRKASVLVPLCSTTHDIPSLLFTVRSPHVTTHKSEISFPGGHHDPAADEDLVQTALRETREELIIHHPTNEETKEEFPWEDVIILGTATPIPSLNGTPVTPILAVLPYQFEETSLSGNPGEVERVFMKSIHSLKEEETTHEISRLGSPAPLFPTEHGNIWGLTAFILRPLLHKLLHPVLCGTTDDAVQTQ